MTAARARVSVLTALDVVERVPLTALTLAQGVAMLDVIQALHRAALVLGATRSALAPEVEAESPGALRERTRSVNEPCWCDVTEPVVAAVAGEP